MKFYYYIVRFIGFFSGLLVMSLFYLSTVFGVHNNIELEKMDSRRNSSFYLK